jgi:hypothetical protein
MSRTISFQCEECSGFLDPALGCLNALCWNFGGRSPLNELPTPESRLDAVVALKPVTLGQLIEERRQMRESKRRYRARVQADYLAGMIEAGKKPRVWRRRGMSARMLKAVGVSPL